MTWRALSVRPYLVRERNAPHVPHGDGPVVVVIRAAAAVCQAEAHLA